MAVFSSICMFLFGIANCYSAEGYKGSITGEVCLKTALQFPNKCSFLLQAAHTYFKTDNETCQRKCRVTIYGPGENMNPGYFYALHTITGIFGDKSINDNKCVPSSQAKESHLRINCSSWKQDDYLIGDRPNCKENGAYCSYIGHVCICQCLPGYITVNGRCLHVNVRVGNACSSDLQCTGTDKAGVCSNGSCDCQMGYLHIYGMCVEGVFPNKPCKYSY
ncbi:prion-like-(Q/N-rich) domain-bearing protein 25 [Crassostrea virginica]